MCNYGLRALAREGAGCGIRALTDHRCLSAASRAARALEEVAGGEDDFGDD